MTQADHGTLSELDNRIVVMEKRLKNAKAARDSYIDYLRSKYPMWNFTDTSNSTNITDNVVMNRLATADYNWDEKWDNRTTFIQPCSKAELHNDIPRSGPLLKSDIVRVRHRLTEIANQLKILRETRLNWSTEDYSRSRYAENIHDDSDTLLAIRNRLSDISLTCFEPLETPTAEKISVMKFNEQRDAYIADLRAGRIPFNVVESVKPIVSTSSVTDNPMISEISQRKSDKQDHTENAEMTKTTKTDDVQTHTSKSDERIVTFEESQNTKVETKPIDPNRTSSSYQKMIGILGQMDTSDTDDDAVGLAKTATTHEKPRSLNPPSQQKSSNTLSQYLFTAQKADAATSSDSDDDFFK